MRLKRRGNLQKSDDVDFDFSDEEKKGGGPKFGKKPNKMRESKMTD